MLHSSAPRLRGRGAEEWLDLVLTDTLDLTMNSEPSHGLSLLWVCLSGCVQAPAVDSVHNERNTCSRTSDPITSSTPPTGPTPSLLNTSQNSLRTSIRGTLIVVLLRRKRVSRYIPSCSDTEKQNFFIRTLRLAQSPGLPGPAGTFYHCWSGHACFLCRVNELRSGKKSSISLINIFYHLWKRRTSFQDQNHHQENLFSFSFF